jgi:hypothetical protein
MPPISEPSLPLSLARAFHLGEPGQLLELLKFLLPLTTSSIHWERLG